MTTYFVDDIRDHNCSSRSPCGYGEGDCGDDGGCQKHFKCGVNNCGEFVAGMAGSCCAVLHNSTINTYTDLTLLKSDWTAWAPSAGDWQTVRARVFWPGDDCQDCLKLQVKRLLQVQRVKKVEGEQ